MTGISLVLALYNISLLSFIATLGIGGLAIALALQETLSNVFSELYSLSKQMNVADFVRLQSGVDGYIHDIGWRVTSIRSLDNNIVLIPNNDFSKWSCRTSIYQLKKWCWS